MDDAIDEMNRTAKLIRLYEVRSFTPIMQEMGELIVRASKVSLEAVPLLRAIGEEADLDAVLETDSFDDFRQLFSPFNRCQVFAATVTSLNTISLAVVADIGCEIAHFRARLPALSLFVKKVKTKKRGRPATGTKQPWVKAGVSKATWYRNHRRPK
jgi:hypothetical protein